MPRAIQASWLPHCAPQGATGKLDLDALGDFDPSPETHAVVDIGGRESVLSIPDTTRAVVVDAETRFGQFRGVASVGETGDVPVSLWPADKACALHRAEADAYPSDVTGLAMGYAESESLVVLSGGAGNGNGTTALVLNLATGAVTSVEGNLGPRKPRIGGTVTRFGGGLLVAGGLDLEDGGPIPFADVFDPTLRGFQLDFIELERPRADHAAVVLPSGETLLVGGRDGPSSALRGLEAISPDTRSYRVSGLARLSTGRAKPAVLTLTDGRILVAGGLGADGTPIETLEWLSADAGQVVQQSTLRPDAGALPTADRLFVAMPGGSALAVGGCRIGASDMGCLPCASGGGCASSDVFWITRDGVPESVPDALEARAVPALLVAGSEGRPWLFADTTSGRVLLRFDPWLGRFSSPDDAPSPPLPGFETPSSLGFEGRVLAVDPGLFLWLGRPAATPGADGVPPVLVGFRHDTRSPYASTVTPLLLTGGDGVAPDRRNRGAEAGLDPDTGEAVLTDSGNALAVTDTTYADLHLSIDVTSGPPPLVELGPDVFGDSACRWPADSSSGVVARVDRLGTEVTLAVGKKSVKCAGKAGRVSILLRSPGPVVRVRSIDVRRSP